MLFKYKKAARQDCLFEFDSYAFGEDVCVKKGSTFTARDGHKVQAIGISDRYVRGSYQPTLRVRDLENGKIRNLSTHSVGHWMERKDIKKLIKEMTTKD